MGKTPAQTKRRIARAMAPKEACRVCNGEGAVCDGCGFSFQDCECGRDDGRARTCTNCMGKGKVRP